MLDLCAGADGPADALADALERSTPAGTRPPRIVLSDLYRRARGVAGRARPASPGDRSGRRAGRCHAHPRRSGAGPRADHRQRLPSFPAAAGRGDPRGRRARLGGHLRERGLRPNTARLAGVRASRPRGARRNAAAHTTCRPCASIAPRTARMVAPFGAHGNGSTVRTTMASGVVATGSPACRARRSPRIVLRATQRTRGALSLARAAVGRSARRGPRGGSPGPAAGSRRPPG